MKAKLATVIVAGLLSCNLALAQDNAGSTTNATENANAVTEAPPAETDATPEAAPVAAASPGIAPTEEIIPLIQFQDVQLTTAIENLARQASINFILDPKVGYGQLDERGQPRPQPSISIRWENITASQALNALLNNYGLQAVEDSKTKIARITTKDPAAPEPLVTEILQLKFAGASNMLMAVQATLTDKRSKVIADVRSSQLVVVATEKELSAVTNLIAKLDTQTRQVLIEAKLVETSFNPSTSKGIDWSGTLGAQKFTFGNGVIDQFTTTTTTPADSSSSTTPNNRPLPGSSSGYNQSTETTTIGGRALSGGVSYNTLSGLSPAIGFLNADGVSAVLSFLNQAADARVIATPRAVTLDNETANLSVTRAEPIINVQAGTQNTAGGSQITYTNLGVILQVTPRISANNYINLKVTPEVSRLFATRSKSIGDGVFQADAYDMRRIETTVMIPSGNTLIMGGLVSDDSRTGNTKVPILGDIPIIGLAFRKDTKALDKANLMIFITPTVLEEMDFQRRPRTTFMQTPPADSPNSQWSAWDDGKPYDWSARDKGVYQPVPPPSNP